MIPLKGQVLTQTARFWFEATQGLCPNHVIEYPDPNVLVCKRLSMMPVEIVVRDYLAGTTSTSILQMYKKGEREMYGHRFAEGLRDNQKLPRTIITPTTKAEQGEHDAPLSARGDPRAQAADREAVAGGVGQGAWPCLPAGARPPPGRG